MHPQIITARNGGFDSPKATISEIRLIAAMRKIDPDLAHMIESLAPVYLVKQ